MISECWYEIIWSIKRFFFLSLLCTAEHFPFLYSSGCFVWSLTCPISSWNSELLFAIHNSRISKGMVIEKEIRQERELNNWKMNREEQSAKIIENVKSFRLTGRQRIEYRQSNYRSIKLIVFFYHLFIIYTPFF